MDEINDIEPDHKISTKNSRSDSGSGWKSIVGLFIVQVFLH